MSVEGELRDFLHEVDVASILQDARYLVANAGIQDAYGVVYVLRRDGRVIGLAGFVHEPSFLRIGVGPIGLPRLSIWRYVARAEPLFAPDVSEDEQYRYSAAMVADIMASGSSRDLLFLQGVNIDSPFARIVQNQAMPDGAPALRAVQHGSHEKRWVAKLAESTDAYLDSLSRSTRQSVRRSTRKFTASFGADVCLKCFSSPGEVASFLDDAIPLSEKTYQYQRLGGGLRDREHFDRLYSMGSENGWFQSYILYVDQEPIAFMTGLRYGPTYNVEHLGYDPNWAQHRVGIIMILEIIDDLIQTRPEIKWYDFGLGDNQYKSMLSHVSYTDGYYFVFPRTVSGSALAAALHSANACAAGLKHLVAAARAVVGKVFK